MFYQPDTSNAELEDFKACIERLYKDESECEVEQDRAAEDTIAERSVAVESSEPHCLLLLTLACYFAHRTPAADEVQAFYAETVGRLKELQATKTAFTDRRYQDILYLIRMTRFKAASVPRASGVGPIAGPILFGLGVHILLAGGLMQCFDCPDRDEKEREAISGFLQCELEVRQKQLSEGFVDTIYDGLEQRIVDEIKSPLVLSKALAAIDASSGGSALLFSHRRETERRRETLYLTPPNVASI